MNDAHEMRLEILYADGTKEWVCPICGRRVQLKNRQMTILNRGDLTVEHCANDGSFRSLAAEVSEEKNE